MHKAFLHFCTITRHRHMVMYYCFLAGIVGRGLLHDLSKYSMSEFLAGAKYYQGNRSPNEREREVDGSSKAWMHHKGRNRHHFEYWTDYSLVTKTVMPVEMPKKYFIEMFCDRIAASRIYYKQAYTNDRPLLYFLNAKGRRMIHPNTSDKLEMLLRMLAEEGEKKTFSFIRKKL